MAHIKIINLQTEDEPEEIIEESKPDDSEDYDEGEYTPPRRRYRILLFLIIVSLIAYVAAHTFMKYEDFEVRYSTERNDTAETSYVNFNKNLLKYNHDGAFYTTYEGAPIWNYTYDMKNPKADFSANNILIYDKGGSDIAVLSTTGLVKSLSTNMPIVMAKVADQGTFAVLMQENSTSHIKLYDTKGNVLASGELYPENSGYPIDMDISSDAKTLVVSLIDLNNGYIQTTLRFYNFGAAGKAATDNIIANYIYNDMLIPDVEFLAGDKLLAMGDNNLLLFNNNDEVTIAKSIYIPQEITSVFYNNKYYGYISDVKDEEGNISTKMTVYNTYGMECFSKEIDEEYKWITIMDNNEIALSDGNSLSIYNMRGIRRFQVDLEENLYAIMSGDMSLKYILIEENVTEEIRLK